MDGGVYARARSGWRGIGAFLGELLSPFAYFHLFFTTLDDDMDPDPGCQQFYVHRFSPSTLPQSLYSFPPCQVPSPDRPGLLHINYTLNNADGCKGRIATGDSTDRWCMALLDVEKPLESWNVLETTGKVHEFIKMSNC